MSNLISPAVSGFITFENTDLRIIDRDGCVWLTGADLSRALGYAKTTKVTDLYNRNKHEFSEGMTALVTLDANEINSIPNMGASKVGPGKTRVYSSRGCHLIAMLSRTEKAGIFRRWVLDVLENLNQKPVAPQHITNGQARLIRENFRQNVFEKASELLVTTDFSESQRIINAEVEKRVTERMELLTADRHSGVRILTESNENGDYSSMRLLPCEHLISNNEIADHILSVKGPRLRDISKIMQACMTRMSEVYELPLGAFNERGDDL